MIRDNEDIFATSDKDLGCTDTVQMTIDTGDHPPIKLKPYRAPLNQRKIIDKAIEELLEANIIRKSRSAWAAPIIIVSKRIKHQGCVDYRSLNAASKIYSFPLPLIDDLLASVGKAKGELVKVPLLAYPDLNKPYVLYTDASDNCVGACLTQVQGSPIKGENEVERPIYFLSHKLSDTQTRWSTIEKEAFAIHYALQKLNHYLYNAEFVIKTDHKPLKYILESPMQNKKIQLWALNIMGYNCTIQYIPGPQNVCADFMSRLPSDEKQNENPDPYPDISDNTYEINVINSNRFHFTDYANNDKLVEDIPEKENFQFEEFDMSIEQVKDKTLRELKEQLVSDKVPEAVQNKYIIIDDILYYISNVDNDPIIRLYIPSHIKQAVVEQYHDKNGHMGIDKTFDSIRQKYFWPNMFKELYNYVTTCVPCQSRNLQKLDGTTTKAHAEQIRLAKLDWEIPNNNQGKALRKAAYVVPVESQSEDSSDDESIDSDTPMADDEDTFAQLHPLPMWKLLPPELWWNILCKFMFNHFQEVQDRRDFRLATAKKKKPLNEEFHAIQKLINLSESIIIDKYCGLPSKFTEIIERRTNFAEMHNIPYLEHLRKWTVENFKAIGWLKRSNRFGVYYQEVILDGARKMHRLRIFNLEESVMKWWWFSLVLFGLTSQFIVKENVMFQKIKEISTTRSNWLITFVVDLDPFELFLNKIEQDLNKALSATQKVHTISMFYTPEKKHILATILSLQREVEGLNRTKDYLQSQFNDYKSLYYDETAKFRTKRSLFPIIGKALSFLFGTVSDSDLSKIRRNIKTLAQNQDAIRHIVQDGLTILNTTQTHVSENRHKVNELIESVQDLGNRLKTFATDLEKQIEVMGSYLQAYLHMDMIIGEIKDLMNIAGII
ncbi:unnamed protein product [Mytilus coruscus]|uniref:Integrase catalytic domain-containing protein n=1 Tax=Mytilus coruscus TaxID=42192 RepID=A0A6J8D7B6_MYTCO|nr:unnamed protein product [Mytilus coruscus]